MARRQLKPNVSLRRVKGRDGKFRIYYYYRLMIDGKEKFIRIKAEPDTPEFDRIYWSIRSGKSNVLSYKTTYDSLIESYLKSRGFRSKADGTKRKYRATLEAIRISNGSQDYTRTRRRDIAATQEHFSHTPRKADGFVQMFSILFNHAIELEAVTVNPAKSVKLFGPQKSIEPWPQAKQIAYENYCLNNGLTVELMAFRLGTGTGQRPGDLVKMKWSHFDGEYMSVIQEKTKTRIWVYCPQRLQEALHSYQKTGEYILNKGLRQHLSYDALEKRFRRVKTAKEVSAEDYSMHGWRFTAAVEMAEAGCTDAEIQAVTGHLTLEMVQKYRAQANQRMLSKQGQIRRDAKQNKTET